jgi:hypothetical protein
MKKCSTRRPRRLLLQIIYYAQYADQIYEMEKALARKPEMLQIDIIGSGELPPDTALLIRSILQNRSAQTHLITNARSSLQGGSVLVWLLGDTRLIREDAKLYFRRPLSQEDDEEEEAWKEEAEQPPEVDLEESDYAQVVQHINEYLPVKELAGCPIGLSVLRQFGLVDNEKGDRFLASAFAKRENHPQIPQVEPTKTPSPPVSQVRTSNPEP